MRKKVVKLYNDSKEEEEEDHWHDAREHQDEQWYDTNPEEKLAPILSKHGIKKKVKKVPKAWWWVEAPKGGGWRLRVGEFRPLRVKCHMPLPKPIDKKKAIINMKNTDDECFKWAVTRALNPVEHNPERISKELKEHTKELNWEGTEFPTPLSNIKKFVRK
ncbi:Hypothetical predicted protein [Paramuricea clavata]|uniref:Uncharacterized protein n=1 Tax=Paramuricea clavata TaxID=317549 RepID=A0A6S7HPM1_PARCT|nr:Hypothetical predicted protein [Paramuricea clavata]